MHPKRLLLLTLIISFAVVLAGCAKPDNSDQKTSENYVLKSSVEGSDGLKIFTVLLKEPRFKEVADRVAPLTVRVIASSEPFDYAYSEGNVAFADDLGKPDFTLRTSRDVALAVLNADDGFRVFACAMKADAATFEATNLAYAASFNAAKGRILESASDCTAKVGDKVTFRELTGILVDGKTIEDAKNKHNTKKIQGLLPPRLARMGGAGHDFLVFNEWRAPTAWIENEYNQYCSAIGNTVEDGIVKWGVVDVCGGAGTSAPSSDLADCAEKVKVAYKDDDEKAQAEGWGAGLVAARAADKAAEEALCQLVFGGV